MQGNKNLFRDLLGDWRRQVTHTEQGCIPMAFVQPVNPNYLPIGANGGCVARHLAMRLPLSKTYNAIVTDWPCGRPSNASNNASTNQSFDLFLDRIFCVIRHHLKRQLNCFLQIALP